AMFAGFLFLYGKAIVKTWLTKDSWAPSSKYVYAATTLAGLVGGVAAMTFNERLPEDPAQKPPPAAEPMTDSKKAEQPRTPSATGIEAVLTAIKQVIAPNSKLLFQIVSTVYVLGYLAVGGLAAITWMARENTPELVKNLALITFGLLVAIARSFFNVPK